MAITEINLPNDEFLRRTRLKDGDGKLYLKCINIGQGDCTFIVCPNGKRMLIDAGSTEWGDTDIDKVKANLPYKDGELPIEVLVMTHPCRDHYSQLGQVLGKSAVGMVYYGYDLGQYKLRDFRSWANGWSPYRDNAWNYGGMEELFVNKDNPAPRLLLDGGDGCKLTAIAANVKATRSTTEKYLKNTASVVVLCNFGSDRFIVAGDATCDTEAFILAQYKDKLDQLKVKILRVAHHGSASSSMSSFVDATAPPIAIISCSERSKGHGLPRKTVVDRFLPKLQDVASHTIGYYNDQDAAECSTLIEDSEELPETNLPFVKIDTKKNLWETSFQGTFSTVLTGK